MLFAAIVLFTAALIAALLGNPAGASDAAEAGLVIFVIFAVLAAVLAGLGAIAVKMEERRRTGAL